MSDSQIKEDFEFLLSFVPATSVKDVVNGLCSSFYFTGSFEDDKRAVLRIEEIISRYNINIDDIEELS